MSRRLTGILVLALATGTAVAGQATDTAGQHAPDHATAADAPHWDVTTRVLATIRERSIEARAANLTVPNLADPALIALGAEHYAGMCTGCHLSPGVGDNEMRQGLYPQPPDLSQPRDRRPAQSFWIIKHGLKMSGMPAWGVTHDDEAIWGLVAFLQQLPTLDATAYAALTQDTVEVDQDQDAHAHSEHDHDHGDDGAVSAASATMGQLAEAGPTHVHPDGEGHDQ